MRMRWLAAGLIGLAVSMTGVAQAQRGPAGGDNWEMLGRQTVGFGTDTDTIRISENEGFFRDKAFRTLRFVAEGNDVMLNSIRLVYINGHAEDIRVERQIRRGSDLRVDLPGERSFLRQIDMRYKGNVGISFGGGGIKLQQATVSVYGERASRRPAPPPVIEPPRPPMGGWSELDSKSFNLQDDRVELRASRGDGRMGQIRLRADGERIGIRAVAIRFRNGEVQNERLDARLEPGQETRPIDLEGDQRALESVTVNLDPRRRPGRASLALLATPRAGRDGGPGPGPDRYSERGWVALGQQTVGFTTDRDVITLNEPGDGQRDRAYRRLHFVAERNDVNMQSVRVVYMNGYAEDFRIDREIRAGSDVALDLRGERSFIRQIAMSYRSRPSFKGQAIMKVYGEPVRR